MNRAVCALSLLAALSGCEGTTSAIGLGKVKAPVVPIPSQILGLRVAPEDVSDQIKSVKRRYIDAAGVFSLREDDLLRATFQISRFNRLARPRDAKFRSSIIGLVGGSNPLEIKVNDIIVYSTTGTDQNVFVWFRGRGFYVLSVHQEYPFPRTLLRRVLTLDLPI